MEIKRVHIAHFSPTGTTKRTLRAVAEGFGCSELSETDWADPKSRAAILKIGPDELVIAGMPVYYGRIPSLFHEGLPLRGEGTPFVPGLRCTATGITIRAGSGTQNARRGGGVRDARCRRVRGAALPQSRYGPWAPRRFRSRGHEAFRQCSAGQGGGLAGSMPPLSVPGAFPYKEYKPTPFAPELLDAETCIRCGLCAGRARFGSLIPRHMP